MASASRTQWNDLAYDPEFDTLLQDNAEHVERATVMWQGQPYVEYTCTLCNKQVPDPRHWKSKDHTRRLANLSWHQNQNSQVAVSSSIPAASISIPASVHLKDAELGAIKRQVQGLHEEVERGAHQIHLKDAEL